MSRHLQSINKPLDHLTPPQKKEAAKQLILNGYSARKVEEVLKIDHVTATRYAQEETPENMKQFGTLFTNFLQQQKEIGLNLVHKRLNELVPRERRIDQVVKAGEFFEGRKETTTGLQMKDGDREVNIVIKREE